MRTNESNRTESDALTLVLDGYRMCLRHNREAAYLEALATEAQSRINQLRSSVRTAESRWVHLITLLLTLDELHSVQDQVAALREELETIRATTSGSMLQDPVVSEELELPKERPVLIQKRGHKLEEPSLPFVFPPFGTSDSIRDRQRTLFAYLPGGEQRDEV